MFRWLINMFNDASYNRELYRSGKANKNEIRHTAIGWQPDESFIPDPGNKNTDGKKYDTPSGNKEFYKVVRKK